MAKQIFISDDAYKILLENKRENDSFSNVILRKFKNKSNYEEIVKVAGKYKTGKDHLSHVKKKWREWEKKFV